MSFMEQVGKALKLRQDMNKAHMHLEVMAQNFGTCSPFYRIADKRWYDTITPCMDAEIAVAERIMRHC